MESPKEPLRIFSRCVKCMAVTVEEYDVYLQQLTNNHILAKELGKDIVNLCTNCTFADTEVA